MNIMQASIRERLEPLRMPITSRLEVADEFVDYRIAIRTGVMLNILVQWVKNGKQQAPDDLANALSVMLKQMSVSIIFCDWDLQRGNAFALLGPNR